MWRTALIALAILVTLSEASYMLLGMMAQRCLGSLSSSCGPVMETVSQTLFIYANNDAGAPVFAVKLSAGLPAFHTLFYLILAGNEVHNPEKFFAAVSISLIAGFVSIWGFLATSAGRGAVSKLLLAIAFGFGWFLIFTSAGALMHGGGFFSRVPYRYTEIPIAAASLLAVSFLTRRRS